MLQMHRRVAPNPTRSELVAAAAGRGPHHWAGAPSAAATADGGTALAYRVRNGFDGGDSVVVARAGDDGAKLTTVAELSSRALGARWVERPSIVRTERGRWRLYVCGAEHTGPNWWVAALEAATLEGLGQATPRMVFPGGDRVAVKDPVVRRHKGRWEAWLCCHLLDQPGEEDRMVAEYATSDDGWVWRLHGEVLRGTPGRWDARGTRITGVLPDGSVFYDGRATQAENWFERSSRAVSSAAGPGYVTDPTAPVVDVRYVEVLPRSGSQVQLYYEVREEDETHQLRTEILDLGRPNQ